MADENNAAGAPQPTGPVFQLQRVYLKDSSLELPHAPNIFLEQDPPQVDVQLEVGNDKIVDGIYEITVRVDQFEAVAGIVCPGIVYPYLRANVADLISRTGLPPIHLAEINFEAMFQQRLAQQQANPALITPATTTPQ